MSEQPNFQKLAIGLFVGAAILGGVVYGGLKITKKVGNKIALPAGPNYLGDKAPDLNNLQNPPTAPQRFTAASDVAWKQLKGKVYRYTLSYPESLPLGVFPNDQADAVAIVWGNIPAQANILLNVEKISDRNPKYAGKTEEFVRNWWTAFSGLKGVKSVDKFTTASGLTGYKASYINAAGQTPNVDVFIQIPDDQNSLIHMANGILDPTIFDRMVDTLKYTASSPSPSQ
ncbi:MAG: hypothetical protein Q8Q24_00760 [bacterium]|nr:hypothetical protein [bacterium]